MNQYIIYKSKIKCYLLMLLCIWSYFMFSIGTKLVVLSLPTLGIVLVGLIILDDKRIVLNNVNFILGLFSIQLLISLFLTSKYNYPFMSIRFCIYFFYGILLFVILTKEDSWSSSVIFTFELCSIIYSVFTIYSVIFPEQYLRFIELLFSERQFIVVKSLMQTNGYAGIAGQTGNNAFMMSIGFGILFNKFYYNENSKIYNLLKMLFVGIGILLTAKRAYILIHILCVSYIIIMDNNLKRKINISVFSIISAIFVASITIYLMKNVSGVNVFDTILDFKGDISSGRFTLYKEAFRQFMESPIIGNGPQSFLYKSNILSSSNQVLEVHNIYLQLLCEMGLIGLILFILVLSLNLVKVLKVRSIVLHNDSLNKYKCLINISLYIQLVFMIVGVFGNPINDVQMLYIYFIFASIPYGLVNNIINKK